MILWSGGLDSTWLLSQQENPVDVLSIHLKHHAERSDRSTLESNARNRIKLLFPQHNYLNAKLEIETNYGIRDMINSVFIAGQYAWVMNYNENDRILFGANCDDDYNQSWDNVAKEIDLKMQHALKCSYGDSPIPNVTWDQNPPSRKQQLEDLGDIANLTWSCRNPQFKNNKHVECLSCVPCIHINKAKISLEGI